MSNYIKRILELNLPQGQSCFLWGARKTGKSTFLKKSYPEALWIDLLQADIYQKYLLDPSKLRQELEAISPNPLVIIDEIQKVPALLDEIHWLIENKKIQFILCGSSSRRLRAPNVNLLGGRAWRYMFVPFCYEELKELNWHKIFNNGLIPSHYFSQNAQKSLAAYLFDYVLNEVHAEAQLRQKEPFAKFLDSLGIWGGKMINYTNISKACGVNLKTIQTYFEILVDMYLGYFVKPYSKSTTQQDIQSTPKFYLFDTGVANYLKRFKYTEMRGREVGESFEHYVFLELMAYKLLKDKREDICYWKGKEKDLEVDFIVKNHAFEVKTSTSIDKNDIKNLLIFGKDVSKFSLNIICFEPQKRIIERGEKKITVWPIEEFLQTLWRGEIWE
ncbi:MAG: AAA family ATPase [Alphaproteobacteria bacterium]